MWSQKVSVGYMESQRYIIADDDAQYKPFERFIHIYRCSSVFGWPVSHYRFVLKFKRSFNISTIYMPIGYAFVALIIRIIFAVH